MVMITAIDMVDVIVEHLTWGIPDTLSTLRPASEADYRKVELGIREQRRAWIGHLLPAPGRRPR
ncbi:MAG: hypothetical protein ACRDJK_06245 [Actinomycetota bacterium]